MVGDWQYAPAQDLGLPLQERLRAFPRQPDMLVYGARLATALVIRSWLWVYNRLDIIGRENLPRDGSFVLVANHASHLDALCMLAALPLGKLHRAFPAAARDYFFETMPRLLTAAVVVNALPFGRQTHIRQSLSLCSQLLANRGNILLVFPEGTRSPQGELGQFKPGIGLLVAGTDHPVVPCFLQGTRQAFPKGSWFPRPCPVQLIIGKPRTYQHFPGELAAAHQISQDLREAVLALADGNRGEHCPTSTTEVAS